VPKNDCAFYGRRVFAQPRSTPVKTRDWPRGAFVENRRDLDPIMGVTSVALGRIMQFAAVVHEQQVTCGWQSRWTMHAYITSPNVPRLDIPPTSELFSKEALVERHPNLLTYPRVQWALRNRARNGLSSVVYESKSGQLLVHEPEFLRWYLGLTGRSKPRASRILRPGASPRSLQES
jgi:hypothetical protein